MSGHIVLLGDSIFDNAAYVPGGPAVIEHLRRLLAQDWQATLLATDGAVVSSVPPQLERVPKDATHLVLSVGGNDALRMSGSVLSRKTHSVYEGLAEITTAIQEFAAEYRALVRDLLALRKPLAVCTIYDGVPRLGPAEIGGLAIFNDIITRTAAVNHLTLIDLRVICNEATDYSSLSPIEPSATGGGKIGRAIVSAVRSESAGSRVIALQRFEGR